MDNERLWNLAERAAGLLPEAPDSGNALDWMSWRELVWETAERLGEIGGPTLEELHIDEPFDDDTVNVSATHLLQLSARLHRESAVGSTSADASMPQPY